MKLQFFLFAILTAICLGVNIKEEEKQKAKPSESPTTSKQEGQGLKKVKQEPQSSSSSQASEPRSKKVKQEPQSPASSSATKQDSSLLSQKDVAKQTVPSTTSESLSHSADEANFCKKRKLIKDKGKQIANPINIDDDNDDDDEGKEDFVEKFMQLKDRYTKRKQQLYKESEEDDEPDECEECKKVAKIDATISQIRETLHGTQQIVNQLVANNNKTDASSSNVTKNKGKARMIAMSNERAKKEMNLAGDTINMAILGVYLSLIAIYNGDDKLNVLGEISPQMVEDIGDALNKHKGLVNDKLKKYIDEIKYRQLKENGQFLPNNMLIKNMQGFLQAVEQKVTSKKELFKNINFYINLYADMKIILTHQQTQTQNRSLATSNNANASPTNLVDVLKSVAAIIDKLLAKFHVLLQKATDAEEEERRNPVIVEISSDSSAGEKESAEKKRGQDEKDSAETLSDSPTDELDVDLDDIDLDKLVESTNMEHDSKDDVGGDGEKEKGDGDNDDDEENEDEDEDEDLSDYYNSSDFDYDTDMEYGSDDDDDDDDDDINPQLSGKFWKKLLMPKQCKPCAERAKIDTMLDKMKVLITLLIAEKTDENIPLINAIGATIYAIKLTILPLPVETKHLAMDVHTTVNNFNQIYTNLEFVTEPIDKKMLAFLDITKHRLMVEFESNEQMIEAQTNTLKEIITKFSPADLTPETFKNWSSIELHNLAMYHHLFTELSKRIELLEELKKSMPKENKLVKLLEHSKESVEKMLKKFADLKPSYSI
ncbi:hypothetical protein niasHT_004474 [Heterodera trifolii]|uniref:Uncharacterized protein n=1 Tax=Heterodera trifolii TaxID=157864 RepID=A0ABD2MDE0_9BILA